MVVGEESYYTGIIEVIWWLYRDNRGLKGLHSDHRVFDDEINSIPCRSVDLWRRLQPKIIGVFEGVYRVQGFRGLTPITEDQIRRDMENGMATGTGLCSISSGHTIPQ